MSQSDVEKALRMARVYAAQEMTWFAPALLAARLVLSDKCPLAAIDDGMRVYFNVRRIQDILDHEKLFEKSLPQLAWIWVHEIAHALRLHGQRAREKEVRPDLWNIATDLEINDAQWGKLLAPMLFPPLLSERFKLPEGKLAEFYYDQLIMQEPEGGRQEERKGISESTHYASRREASEGAPTKSSVMDEGSGVHGKRRSWELPDECGQTSALSDLEQELKRREVAENIANSHKDQGDIPLGWKRWAEKILAPKVDWRERLKHRLRGAIVMGTGQRVDYSFHRTHRRSDAFAPFLPPSLTGDFIPHVICIVDTSGSIRENELCQALAEVRSVLECLRIPIIVIPCDQVPYDPIKVFTQSDFLRLYKNMRGGGGTNMVAGIEAALRLRPLPDTVIVLTDGYTNYPPRRYKIPVIFGIFTSKTETGFRQPTMPPWRKEDVVNITL